MFYKRFVSFFSGDTVVLSFHDVTDHLAFAAVDEIISNDRLVIDDGINALVVELDERFIGVVVLFDISTFDRACLRGACRSDLCTNSLADEVIDALDVSFIRTNQNNQTGCVIRIAEVDSVFTFFGNGHSGDSQVDVAGRERRDQTVEPEINEFNLVTHLFTECFSQVDVKTGQVIGSFSLEFERCKCGVGTNAQNLFFLGRGCGFFLIATSCQETHGEHSHKRNGQKRTF